MPAGLREQAPSAGTVRMMRRSVRPCPRLVVVSVVSAHSVPVPVSSVGERLIPLEDQDIVRIQLAGDQAGGGLGGLQHVQGQDQAGHLQAR